MDRLNLTWLALVALTVLSAALGELAAGGLLPAIGLLLAALEGQLVLDVFMGLREGSRRPGGRPACAAVAPPAPGYTGVRRSDT